MKINIIGHHLEITDGLKDHIEKKLKKIEGHSQEISEIKIILSVDNIPRSSSIDVVVVDRNIVLVLIIYIYILIVLQR